MLCSNGVLERLFGNLRQKYRQCAIDNLEIIYGARAMQACTNMMAKHPDWFQRNRNVMQHLCLDYSDPKDWGAENLVIRNVNIVSTLNIGRANAEQILDKLHKYKGDRVTSLRFQEMVIPY